MKQAIVIHADMRAGVRVMTDEQAGQLFKAACAWADGYEYDITNDAVKLVWEMVRSRLEDYSQRYEKKCLRNRENARGGTRSPATASDEERSLATASEAEPPLAAGGFSPKTKTKTKTKTKDSLRESPPTPKGVFDGWFEEVFWKAYPRKTAKKKSREAARKVWTEEDADGIMAGLERAKESDQWRRDGGRFIPHAATWLNQERWTDEEEPSGYSEDEEENKKSRARLETINVRLALEE
jgi:hypothetical protein